MGLKPLSVVITLINLNMTNKTISPDRAVSAILKYLLQLLGLALFYGFILYTTVYFWIPFLVQVFSKVYYAQLSYLTRQMEIMLIVYTVFCYFVNNFVLHLYEKGKTKQLIFSIIGDIMVLPVCFLILVIYNNIFAPKHYIPQITDLYNIYLVMGLLIVKEIITASLLSKQAKTQKKK